MVQGFRLGLGLGLGLGLDHAHGAVAVLLAEPRLLANANAVLSSAGAAACQGALKQPVVDGVQPG